MSAGSPGTNSSGEAASFFQWLKVMSTFQEATDEIRGQLAARGKCALSLRTVTEHFRLCTDLCQHWVQEAPAEGADGVGASHSKELPALLGERFADLCYFLTVVQD